MLGENPTLREVIAEMRDGTEPGSAWVADHLERVTAPLTAHLVALATQAEKAHDAVAAYFVLRDKAPMGAEARVDAAYKAQAECQRLLGAAHDALKAVSGGGR